MFEVIQPVAPSPSPVGDAEVDALERAFWSDNADHFAFLPGPPIHCVELPRHRQRIGVGGTTLDELLVSLDPRVRRAPQERWIVERGVSRRDDGRATGQLPRYTFRPEGYSPPLGQWLDQTVTWSQAETQEGHERWPLGRCEQEGCWV
jgi:hypothetical protein